MTDDAKDRIPPPPDPAADIVRRSGSNLAFAFSVLPREKRDDMGVLYAFCRVIDDIADEPGREAEERRRGLAHWRTFLERGCTGAREGLERELAGIVDRYGLPPRLLLDILDGVEMDLEPRHFDTALDLEKYCYHVASAVGLASIEIFGYTDTGTRAYAEQLGYALQWTNILRDVGEDAAEGRVYLPLEDIAASGLGGPEEILGGSPDPHGFARLMQQETERAENYYARAREALAPCDRSTMRSAELMRRIYSGILRRMEKDGWHVYEKRYRLSKPRMLGEFLRAKYLG